MAGHIGRDRAAIYAALGRRNRIVGVLRIVVPIGGTALFAILGLQLVQANVARDFSVGSVSIADNRLNVEAPSYAGRLSDGSSFTVTSSKAEAALGMPSLIELTGAKVLFHRANGDVVTALAASAELDADAQVLHVPGVTSITQQDGTTATVTGLRVDVVGQTVVSDGPAALRTVQGQTLDARSMRYDVTARRWHFEGVTLTLPSTPGEETEQ